MVKKISIVLAALCFLAATTLSGCGDAQIIEGTKYETYGLINVEDVKNPDIEYRPIWGNIIWGCILSETIVAPIYFFGFSMFEPVGKKNLHS